MEDLDENRSRKIKCSSIRGSIQDRHDTGNVNCALYSNNDSEKVDSEVEIVQIHDQSDLIQSRMLAMSEQFSRPSTVERTKLHFSKRRPTSQGNEPSGIVYSVRMA